MRRWHASAVGGRGAGRDSRRRSGVIGLPAGTFTRSATRFSATPCTEVPRMSEQQKEGELAALEIQARALLRDGHRLLNSESLPNAGVCVPARGKLSWPPMSPIVAAATPFAERIKSTQLSREQPRRPHDLDQTPDARRASRAGRGESLFPARRRADPGARTNARLAVLGSGLLPRVARRRFHSLGGRRVRRRGGGDARHFARAANWTGIGSPPAQAAAAGRELRRARDCIAQRFAGRGRTAIRIPATSSMKRARIARG